MTRTDDRHATNLDKYCSSPARLAFVKPHSYDKAGSNQAVFSNRGLLNSKCCKMNLSSQYNLRRKDIRLDLNLYLLKTYL